MPKQNVRRGRIAKILRQERANDPNKPSNQFWAHQLKEWIRRP